jgi:hypothetical protein
MLGSFKWRLIQEETSVSAYFVIVDLGLGVSQVETELVRLTQVENAPD